MLHAKDPSHGEKNGQETGKIYCIVANAAEEIKIKYQSPMVYDTTHPNEDFDQCVTATLGASFGLIERIKMGRIGSRRMMIVGFSEAFWPLSNNLEDLLYGNIELRPKGIILYGTNGGKRMAWIIPYHKLTVYDSEWLSIHAEGAVIKFKKNRNYKENKGFIELMMQKRSDYLSQFNAPFN